MNDRMIKDRFPSAAILHIVQYSGDRFAVTYLILIYHFLNSLQRNDLNRQLLVLFQTSLALLEVLSQIAVQ